MIALQSSRENIVNLNFTEFRQTFRALSILFFATLFVPLNPLLSSGKLGAEVTPKEMVRFNRRYIRINDYLFNGVEDATAIAFSRVITKNPVA